jgi:hypothetical protein
MHGHSCIYAVPYPPHRYFIIRSTQCLWMPFFVGGSSDGGGELLGPLLLWILSVVPAGARSCPTVIKQTFLWRVGKLAKPAFDNIHKSIGVNCLVSLLLSGHKSCHVCVVHNKRDDTKENFSTSIVHQCTLCVERGERLWWLGEGEGVGDWRCWGGGGRGGESAQARNAVEWR